MYVCFQYHELWARVPLSSTTPMGSKDMFKSETSMLLATVKLAIDWLIQGIRP